MFYEYLVILQVLKNDNALLKSSWWTVPYSSNYKHFLNNFGLNILMTLEFEPSCDFPRLSIKQDRRYSDPKARNG